jgi:hypothetical protein
MVSKHLAQNITLTLISPCFFLGKKAVQYYHLAATLGDADAQKGKKLMARFWPEMIKRKN